MIVIKANNPDIGLMCIIPVGMPEVPTCDVTVFEGHQGGKGIDRLRIFHFGGSTHYLLFLPG